MQIQVGYEMIYHFPRETPMILMVHIHYSRAQDIIVPDRLITDPVVPITSHRDIYGNWCSRIVAPVGRIRLSARGVINDSGEPEMQMRSVRPETRNKGSARGHSDFPAGQPVLRDGSAV